jgi:hypothetical protein
MAPRGATLTAPTGGQGTTMPTSCYYRKLLTRIRAAYENGSLNGMKLSRRYSMVMQLNSASKIALKRYAKLAARFNAR